MQTHDYKGVLVCSDWTPANPSSVTTVVKYTLMGVTSSKGLHCTEPPTRSPSVEETSDRGIRDCVEALIEPEQVLSHV